MCDGQEMCALEVCERGFRCGSGMSEMIVVKGAAAFCCSTEREGWTDDVAFCAKADHSPLNARSSSAALHEAGSSPPKAVPPELRRPNWSPMSVSQGNCADKDLPNASSLLD